MLRLIDYVGVDYAEAVVNGEIINPGEHAEMQDYSTAIVELAAGRKGDGPIANSPER